MPKRKGPTRRRIQRRAQAPPAEPRHPQTPFERELTTKRRGEISELAFALAAARHGFGISRPYGDSERYDLILDPSHVDPSNPLARPRLIRVQVKATTQLQYGLYCANAAADATATTPTAKPGTTSTNPTAWNSPRL